MKTKFEIMRANRLSMPIRIEWIPAKPSMRVGGELVIEADSPIRGSCEGCYFEPDTLSCKVAVRDSVYAFGDWCHPHNAIYIKA